MIKWLEGINTGKRRKEADKSLTEMHRQLVTNPLRSNSLLIDRSKGTVNDIYCTKRNLILAQTVVTNVWG